jgi:hypothetical protein
MYGKLIQILLLKLKTLINNTLIKYIFFSQNDTALKKAGCKQGAFIWELIHSASKVLKRCDDCRFHEILHLGERPSHPQELHSVYVPTWELMRLLSQTKAALYATVRRPTCNQFLRVS